MIIAALLAMSSAAPADRWHIAHDSDPMTDARKVSVTLNNPPGAMLIVCDSGSRSGGRQITVDMGRHLGGRPILREVLVRFDQQPSIAANWGHTGRFVVLLNDAGPLIEAIARSRTMAVRATDYRGANVDLTFDLTGSDRAIDIFETGCASIGL